MRDIRTRIGGRSRGARLTCAALTAVLAVAAATPASAATWTGEQGMVDSTHSRGTFVADPGIGERWTREGLINGYHAYYRGRGFGNVLTWVRAPSTITPSGTSRWAGCGLLGDIIGGACPDGDTLHMRAIGLALGDTSISALEYGGAYIALACGNFSDAQVPGPMPTISGTKFEDVDGDGVRDPDEPRLPGWEIQVRQGGTLLATDVTDANGNYSIRLDANAMPITSEYFDLSEVGQAGWAQSRAPGQLRIPFGSENDVFGGNDFGNYRPATINGVKYEDMEADGDRDAGDPLLEGWTIDLDAGPSAPGVDVTDPAGAYAFSGLRPGTYTVSERLQSGWRHSSPADGAHTVTVSSGETAAREFGNYRPATIEGVKFDDHDVDRERDAGEPGLPDWTIEMTGGRSPDATDVTDADGRYAFDGLIPGTYTIAEQLKPGWRQSAPASGTHSVTVLSGETRNALFGNVCLGTTEVRITDEVSGETITGVEVRLEQISVVGVLSNIPSLPRTTTGTPTFADLLPGTYRVIAFLPIGMGTTDDDIAAVEDRFAVVKVITVRECQTTIVPIKFIRTSTGKVTGGMKMEVPGGFATAGFVFMTRQGVPEGSLEYQDHVTGMNLHSEDIDTIHVAGRHAWITGTVLVDGASRQFWLHLVDNGEPGSEDRFHLLVDNGYEAGEDETIIGGNDQIHPPEHT
jgi:hypothetical protein